MCQELMLPVCGVVEIAVSPRIKPIIERSPVCKVLLIQRKQAWLPISLVLLTVQWQVHIELHVVLYWGASLQNVPDSDSVRVSAVRAVQANHED